MTTVEKTAQKIRELRLAKALSQEAVAKEAGMNTNYFAKIERADLAPSLEAYEKIAKALKVTSADIFPF